MIINRFLSAVPFVLLNLRAPEGAIGGGAPATCPEPTGDTLEAKHQSALQIIKDYFTQLGGAFKERDDELAAHSTTKGSLKKEQDDHTATKGSLKKEQDDHTATKGALKVSQDDTKNAKDRTTLIESFCKHHNLDLAGLEKFQAAKEVPEAQGAKSGAVLWKQSQQLRKDEAAGKVDPGTYSKFLSEHKKELREFSKSQK